MRVCDVVLDSVWYDPRVRKQIQGYMSNNIELHVIGIEDNRYDQEEIDALGCNVKIISPRNKVIKHNIINKLKRIYLSNYDIVHAIIDTNPDIIHANDLNALLPSFIAAKIVGAKLIYDTHEIFTENIGIVSNPLLRLFWSIFEWFVIKRVNLVVCVSNAAADYLSHKYRVNNILVITNCCNLVNPNDIPRDKHPGFEILNHGQFYEGRGYDLMLYAAQLSKNPDITYCLRGFGEMEGELRNFVKKCELSNVRFYPPVKVNELIPQAAQSHVGLAITIPFCLNFKLSISNKIFEYTAAGLPVIMSDIPEHSYLNKKYGFGIVLKDNTPEELLNAVSLLYTDKKLYNRLSKNALKFSSEINWEKEFIKLIQFEKSLI